MATTQKDIVGWELVFDGKAGRRRSRKSDIHIKRNSDGIEIKEGDCISLKHENSKFTVFALVKDILLAVDKFLEIKVLLFVQYNETLDSYIKQKSIDEKYTSKDLFLTPFMESIKIVNIVDKINVIGIRNIKDELNNNTFVCRRICDESNTHFTDIIDWETILENFNSNKNEFFETVKLLTLNTSANSAHSSPSKKIKQTAKIEKIKRIGIIYDEKLIKEKPIKKSLQDRITYIDDHDDDSVEDEDFSDNEQDDDDDDNNNSSLDDEELSSVDDASDDEFYGYQTTTSPTKRKRKKSIKTNKKSRKSRKQSDDGMDDDIDYNAYIEQENFEMIKGIKQDDEKYSTTKMLMMAKKVLGTSTKLRTLPCRDEEFYELYNNLEGCIKSEKGRCIYVSGTPGVGKTATVRNVIEQLSAKLTVENKGKKVFNYLEINGLKLVRPQQAYQVLWKKISKTATSANNSLTYLQQYFEQDEENEEVDRKKDNKSRLPLVVLLDELDQIVTKSQSIMYNFFNWPTYEYSKLIIIAVANTMDLPERLLTNKISSRLGLSRIQFTSYSYNQLSEIIKNRLETLTTHNNHLLIAKDAIEFASRKVASVSGDARRSLMICIRAIEFAQKEFKQKSAAEKRELDGKYTVTIMHIMKAINETSNSPVSSYLVSLPFINKFLLICLMLRKKRLGVAEIKVGEIFDELRTQAHTLSFREIKEKLKADNLTLFDILFEDKDERIIKNSSYILRNFEDSGILFMQHLRNEEERIVRLNISDDEIISCFKRDDNLKELIAYV